MFPIVNPFSTAPLFVSLTAGRDQRWINQQALKSCIFAFGILMVFVLLGAAISDFFGISVQGIRVAGGLIIATVGFRMMFPRPPSPSTAPAEEQTLDIAFAPIAMPSLAGPGSISVVLGGATRIRGFPVADWPVLYGGVTVGIAITFVVAFLVLRGASSMVKFLGRSGIDAMTRIFGFLLICISMEFLLGGIAEFYGLART